MSNNKKVTRKDLFNEKLKKFEGGWFPIPKEALSLGKNLRVYAYLLSFMNRRGFTPGIRTISLDLDISINKARRAVNFLESKGFIRISTGNGLRNDYLFNDGLGVFVDADSLRKKLIESKSFIMFSRRFFSLPETLLPVFLYLYDQPTFKKQTISMIYKSTKMSSSTVKRAYARLKKSNLINDFDDLWMINENNFHLIESWSYKTKKKEDQHTEIKEETQETPALETKEEPPKSAALDLEQVLWSREFDRIASNNDEFKEDGNKEDAILLLRKMANGNEKKFDFFKNKYLESL